ncbi:MAG: long-chain fatty acid--CoA ligase [Actinobacteria bacterium]|nr:MAG: long-chain fatty acid--CoA ligase [Actinomycetota bacterium]
MRQPSLCAAFQLTAAANADRPALRTPDDSVSLTWRQYAERVRSIAAGLAALGVGDGDTVALLLANRPEFHLFDTAALHLGAAPFSVYHTNPPDLIRHLLENSDTPVLVTEQAFLEQARESRALHDGAVQLVVVDGPGADDYMTLEELESRGNPDFDFEAAWRAVGPDHLATIVYTSGTTGPPKGVQHSHRVLMFHLNSIDRLAPISPEGRVVSYLPMAHIAERFISHYSSVAFGYTITCCANPKELPKAIATTRPTRFFGVPRIYEKLRAAALGAVEADPSGPLARALEAGIARVRAEQAGEQAPAVSEEHERTFAALREKLGLDQVEWVGVAAAPTPYAVLEFFHAVGVPVAELWGMSECLLSTSNPPARIKLGTVGTAIPGVEVQLAADGEILVRGPGILRDYRKDPERTREAIDEDGWLHSGDIAVCDEDGYFKIVDRKKELIINSAGKNMAPAHIECTIKEESPLIGQVVAIGDARPYVTALVVLDAEAAARLAQDGLPADIAQLVEHERVKAEIDGAVERGNARLARVEQIKTYTLLPATWEPGGDEVTPTMKLKRKPIAEKYAPEIEALYGA